MVASGTSGPPPRRRSSVCTEPCGCPLRRAHADTSADASGPGPTHVGTTHAGTTLLGDPGGVTVAVIGAGAMGRGIAQVAAQAGHPVVLVDSQAGAADRARDDIAATLASLTAKGRCDNVNIGGADNRITLDQISGGLSVVGLNNTVTYKDGDPKVNDTGSGNSIRKG